MSKQTIEAEGASIEEAVKNGLEELRTTIENVDIEIVDEAKSGFLSIGSRKAKVRLTFIGEGPAPIKNQASADTQSADEEKRILDIFTTLITHMGFDVEPEIAALNNKYRIIIKDTKDANLLIGKNGKTIDALQIVTNKMLKKAGIDKQVFIDIKGYVIQKQKNKSGRNWKKKPYSHK